MSSPASGVSRRQFLGGSACNAVGLAAGLVGLSAGAAAGFSTGTVRLGVVGVRRQGRKLAVELGKQPSAEVVALCDIDDSILSRADREVREAGASPRLTRDFQSLLDDSRIDAVVVATPDHSHAALAIAAMRSGKDVYLETPVCHTLEESTALLRATHETGRIVQSGHFERSLAHVRSAIEFVRSGRLGAVPLAKAWAVYRRPVAATASDASRIEAPAGVDYDQWLYPLPERPFDPRRFHRGWSTYWDYGSGELGMQGVALLDLARWGLGVNTPQRVTAFGSRLEPNAGETPDSLVASFRYPAATIQWEHRQWSNHPPEGRSTAVAFYGENGTLVLDRGGWKVYDTKEPAGEDGRADIALHLRDFLEAVRTRREPAAPLESAIGATEMCHLANLAWRSDRELRLEVAGTIANDPETIAMQSNRYRPGVRLG